MFRSRGLLRKILSFSSTQDIRCISCSEKSGQIQTMNKTATMPAFGFYQLFHVLLVVVVFWSGSIASDSFVIESLPGLEGPLPFYLETGYVDVGVANDSTIFFYFVKSERNPEEDPVLVWLSGGPRCSAFNGLALENGPISFVDAYFDPNRNDLMKEGDVPALKLNPNSWTKVANIIFIDAPIGTGYSYSKAGQEANISDTKSARETYQFLRMWFTEYHPEFLSNPFYIAGDSYAGMVNPLIVQEVINGIEVGLEPAINYKGYMLGNPVTDRNFEKNYRVEFAHNMGFIPDELYKLLAQTCNGDYANIDSSNVLCSQYIAKFEDLISDLNIRQILEPYCPSKPKTMASAHYRRTLIGSMSQAHLRCRNDGYTFLEEWANDERVQTALHVKKGKIGIWYRCNTNDIPDIADHGLPYTHDITSSIDIHRNINGKGYRSLIYSGDHDMLVSHISTEAWIKSLNSPIIEEWRPWLLDGQVIGYTRKFSNGMTYATIKGAGHTTPEYKPKESFELFRKWMFNDSL